MQAKQQINLLQNCRCW